MNTLLGEIQRALTMRLYYLAILMALHIPDVCGALEAADGQAKPDRYKTWYRKWLAPKYPLITEDDIYCLRCGVLHQGRFGHPGSQYDRVLFSLPDGRRTILHNNLFENALQLDAAIFCNDVIEAARARESAKQNESIVKANLQRLVQYYPNGLKPYIVGIPIIA
jgi:hypothetical protein